MKKINLKENFKIIKILGKGSFSKVYKIESMKTKKIYALKKVEITNITEKEKINSFKEIKILKEVSNNSIVKFYDAFLDDYDNCLCIIMEYLEGGDLYDLIKKYKIENKRLNRNTILNYFFQILEGLNSLHKNNIFHRDLKTANIFISKNLKFAKIGDFNVSTKVSNNFAYTQTGTPFYAAPEIWRDEPYNNKADIWSLGCILYEWCMLQHPFTGEDSKQLNEKIQKSKIGNWDYFYDNDILNLIRKCLIVDIQKRISSEEWLKERINFIKITNILPIKNKPKIIKKSNNFKLIKIKSIKNINNTKKKNPIKSWAKNIKIKRNSKNIMSPSKINLQNNEIIKHFKIKKKRKIKTAIDTKLRTKDKEKSIFKNKKKIKIKKLQKYKLPEFLKKNKISKGLNSKNSFIYSNKKKKRAISNNKKYNYLIDKIRFKRNLILKSANFKKIK